MTINEAIYDLLDGVNISTDDFPVRKRFVYQELKNARVELIKQELNKNILLSDGSLQTIDCVKLVRTDLSKCNDIPSDEYVLQSVDKLPESIEFKNGIAVFPFLMNGTRIDPWNKATWKQRCRRRYKLADSFGYIMNAGKLMIIDYDEVEELNIYVDGHFKDPEKIEELNKAQEEDCDTACVPIYDHQFICPGFIERRVIEIAKASVLRKMSIPSDSNNNSQFDPNVKSQTQPVNS